MPALQFKNLPAAQTQKIRDTLTAQWQIEAGALNKSWFSDRGKFETAKAKLNAKYQQKELEAFTGLQQQTEEQQRVQSLIRQPRERTRGEEAQLRMELKPEAERLVFPPEPPRGRVPFSPTALIGYQNFMEPFIEATKTSGWGLTGYKREQKDLVKQYLAAREQAGYSDPTWTLTQRRQFDTAWDELMGADRDYKWEPEAPEIRSLRAVGKLQKAVAKNITPLGASVAKKKKRFAIPTEPLTFGVEVAHRMVSPGETKPKARYAQNPDTGERIVSRDGGKTWQKAQ